MGSKPHVSFFALLTESQGTVFVHAVAHLQSTYATKCRLQVSVPKSMGLKITSGKSIGTEEQEEAERKTITFKLGNLQYGQSRDIYLEHVNTEGQKVQFSTVSGDASVDATLTYSQVGGPELRTTAHNDKLNICVLSEAEVAYHQSRSMICEFLSSLFPLQKDEEYETRKNVDPRRHQPSLKRLLENIPARFHSDEYNKSLMEDLQGELPSGQVSLALSTSEYFCKWGCHYFFSLWNAHAKQL